MISVAIIIVALLVAVYLVIWIRREADRMSEIIPGVFISDWWTAIDEATLQRNGITQIICICRRKKTADDQAVYQRNKIAHWQYLLDDISAAPIKLIFRATHKIISGRAGMPPERTLIHCRMGISRSVTVVAAHLMLKYNCCSRTALKKIKSRRSIAQPNPGFLGALGALESHLERPLNQRELP